MSFIPSLRKTPDPQKTPTLLATTGKNEAETKQEQEQIQELLGFLGFGLRSFNNLNQFLEVVPLFASRVNNADGSLLIIFKPDGQARLESLQYNEQVSNQVKFQHLRRRLEQEIQSLSGSVEVLDRVVQHALGSVVKLFYTQILIKNAVVGRLYVFSYDQNYTWNTTRQKLLRLVADQAAVAIENNTLATELIKKERQDRELEIGAEIQRQLLPKNCPHIQGLQLAARCLTASRVGGDYYDFIPIQKGKRWSIVVGDVMGKGVPAGLIMTMTRGMLRAEVLNGHSPGMILEHLNQIMFDDLDKSHRFVTMFYSEYDPKKQVLSYSNAAHLPALLWRSQNSSICSLDTLGAIIGLEPGSRYDERNVQLYAGDVVIYYTDGFTEAANTKGDRFDEENLRFYLNQACQKISKDYKPETNNYPQLILDYIFEKLENFIGKESTYSDDMTLIVLQVQN
ncbi:serine phosphatase RsbU, regulator of sigma subunit [Synechococcus sp. PCC 7502]|uniref:PP2C family protein-serine/threonine phosphatase n=1 Tax=Synechococcus sp. PCC 7502 TaxID=1173263 RepID=UPI00029FAF3A|nr:PP2C family protein-serine/threonine phosphatase [Synechococcus sp. PCC 7502]AFY73616.1 serine phosphatase RsbU, regulator of sigma subunit [Synechococcus sp. PCC 7502]